MKFYTFDCMLAASFTVEAASEEEARRIVSEPLDAADCKILEHGTVELEGEVSLASDLTLAQIDGDDV